ncbi:hypothetical protein [Streptomyces sp. TR02-1]|uniref:hypothetical protein n=1 Tax=Streptomyces sp. TR02-1 TaxID=3385977 RepID=UPI0039A33A37
MLRHTTLSYRRVDETFPPPALDTEVLRDTPSNRTRAAEAYDHLRQQGLVAAGPVPGQRHPQVGRLPPVRH